MSIKSRPGAHCFVQSFCQAQGDPTKAADEPIPANRPGKWCTSKQNRGFSGSNIKRGNAVDEMLSDPNTKLHSVFKDALAKHKLVIHSWQQCMEVPLSAPLMFHGFSPILDCLCLESNQRGTALVPIEVKASRPRKLKRRSARDIGMKAPFDSFADTYGLRHQLQLCLQNAAAGNMRPKGFVAYVDVVGEKVTLVKINKGVWALAQAAVVQ